MPSSSLLPPKPLRPFFFITVVWGEEFRNIFLNVCLPSLLSGNNIPVLDRRAGNQYLICTTPFDRECIRSSKIFALLERYVGVEFIDIDLPSVTGDKYALMSAGHKNAAERVAKVEAYGLFISPDGMLSDGSIAYLQQMAADGKTCVLASALRFGLEPFLETLALRGLMVPGGTITLSGQELAGIALNLLHPETVRYDWSSPYFSYLPVCCFWRVPDNEGIILHSQSWGPMLVSFQGLKHHDTSTFENWTLDGDYVFRNWGDGEGIHVVTDSDDLLYVSFTPLKDRAEPIVRNWTKGAALRTLAFGPLMDPLKRKLLRQPIRVHSTPMSEKWDSLEHEAGMILERELKTPSLLEMTWVRYWRFGWRGFIPQSWRPWLRPLRRLWGGVS